MKILLAQVTSPHIDKYSANCYPLGLMSLAKFLSVNEPGIETRIIVGEIDNNDIAAYAPDIVGLSLLSGFFSLGCSIAAALRHNHPDLPIVFGGHHITYLPGNLPEAATLGVLGEGERTFLNLCREFKRHGRLDPAALARMPGIVFRTGGALQVNPRDASFLSPEEIPVVDNYDICSFKTARRTTFHVIASRGCPHKCRFCSSSPFWGTVRLHSPAGVAAHIEYIERRFDPEVIFLYDDLFVANRRHLTAIRDLVVAKKLNRRTSFCSWIAANIFNRDVVDILKEMNFFGVNIAVESGVPRIYEYLKGTWNDPADNRRAIELAHKNGLLVYSSAIVGSPGETEADLESTYRFLESLPLANGTVAPLKPLPGTVLWEEAKARGLVSDHMDDWAKLESDDLLDPAVPIMADCVDRQTLQKHLDRIKALLKAKEARHRWPDFLARVNTPGKALRYLQRKSRRIGSLLP